jgi:carboxymethylenebutenolidase
MSAISESDPAISVERVELRRPDGVVGAYAACPVRARPNVSSVVVIMHDWGVDESIRDVVRRLAKTGFAAIAPDLYARFGAPSGDGRDDVEAFRPFAQQLERKQYDGDIRAAALWLSTKFPLGKAATIGFSLGGRIALLQGIDNADVFSAACPFYGPLKNVDADKLHVPVCGSYGVKDPSIAADDVRAWRGELRVPNDVRIYNTAGHGFFDERRASYVPAAAADAWKRTVDFLNQHLGRQQQW